MLPSPEELLGLVIAVARNTRGILIRPIFAARIPRDPLHQPLGLPDVPTLLDRPAVDGSRLPDPLRVAHDHLARRRADAQEDARLPLRRQLPWRVELLEVDDLGEREAEHRCHFFLLRS